MLSIREDIQHASVPPSSFAPSCIQLFYSVRNIFLLFYDVVPMYHK